MTTYCQACSWESRQEAGFCGRCGAQMHARCASCAALVLLDLAFCTSCGERLRGAPDVSAAEVQRRSVTVLFADLVGFTALAEQLDPEDLRAVQSDYFNAVRRIAADYGGVVEKYIGDAVMVVFGAPTAHENDPYRAVRTALDLQRELGGAVVSGGSALQLRVGVASGEAVVDLHALRTQGHALLAGNVVNVAARLQVAAPPGGVLVAAGTYRMTVDLVDYVALPAVRLPGKAAPVEIWLATDLLSRPTRAQLEDTDYVGRESELGRAWDVLWSSLRERRPALLTILGPPGIGKSRLVRELHRRVAAQSELLVRWRTGACLPYGEGIGFRPLADIVKSHAGIRDTDPAQEARRRLNRILTPLVAPTDRPLAVAALAPLVGVPDPPLSREEMLASWQAVLLAIATQAPTVLVVEDVHWATLSLLRFIDGLVGAATGLPLVIIATGRPEVFDHAPDWGSGASAVPLPLGPLPNGAVAQLFDSLLKEAPAAGALDRLVSLAGGNPLYAEEYVHMLADTGRGGELGDRPPLPESVQSIIASRLDLLGPVERAVLSAASVIGSTFWPGAAAAVAQLPIATVNDAAAELGRRDFLQLRTDSTVEHEPEWVFRHVLVRDLAYRRLSRDRRAAQHRRAADWLDSLTVTRPADVAELLAHHRLAAFDLARQIGLDLTDYAEPAWRALVAAARQAYALHAYGSALAYVGRALQVGPEQTDPAERLCVEALAAELRFLDNPDAFYAERGVAGLERLAADLAERGHSGDAGRTYTLLGQIEWFRARHDPAQDYLHRSLALFAGEPDSPDAASAHAELARLHMLSYRHVEAMTAARRTQDMAAGLSLPEVVGNAMVTGATAQYLSGDPAGIDELTTAVDFCRAGRLHALRRGLNNLATALQEEGDLRRSYALLDEMAAVGRSAGLGLTTSFSDESMRAYFAGDWNATLLSSADFFGSSEAGDAPWEAQLRALCAWLRVLRSEDPGDDVEQALGLADRAGFTQIRRAALAHGALCRALQGRRSDAAGMLDELAIEWAGDSSVASRDWIAAAVSAAAMVGAAQLRPLHSWLATLPRQTLWVQAAGASAKAALLSAQSSHIEAATGHAVAVGLYDQIGDVTERALAQAAAGLAYLAGDRPDAARPHLEAATSFAVANGATGLLETLTPAVPGLRRRPALGPVARGRC